MKVRMSDADTCQYWVSSESDNGVEYIVDLCEWPLGLDEEGIPIFNGVCGLTHERIHGCRDFIYRCEKNLKLPENKGKIFRCKHVNAAEKYALKLLKPYLLKHRLNMPDEHQI